MIKRCLVYSFFIVLLIVVTVGVSYSFYNYTKTGNLNNVRTGSMNFNAEQGVEVTLSDLFPITASGEITPETPGVGSVTVHVTGDTNYDKGIEYRVKTVNVSGSNGTNLPISVNISYSANGTGKTIGQETDDYFADRGDSNSVYQLLTTDTISENGDLVMGYIAPGETGIDGNITIMAYLDAGNIAITDTHPEELTDTNNDGYIDGTDDTWVDGRTVFTTEEWNQLSSSGVSFQIKVEANEGLWIPGVLESNNVVINWNGITVTEGDIKLEVPLVSVNTDAGDENEENITMEYGTAVLSKYNSVTGVYDDITNTGKYSTVIATIEGGTCSASPVVMTSTLAGHFVDGANNLDGNFVYCKIRS